MNTKLCLIAVAVGFLILDSGSTAAQTKQASSVRKIRTYGLTIPKEQVFVQSAIDGHVAEVYFEEGQRVGLAKFSSSWTVAQR